MDQKILMSQNICVSIVRWFCPFSCFLFVSCTCTQPSNHRIHSSLLLSISYNVHTYIYTHTYCLFIYIPDHFLFCFFFLTFLLKLNSFRCKPIWYFFFFFWIRMLSLIRFSLMPIRIVSLKKTLQFNMNANKIERK